MIDTIRLLDRHPEVVVGSAIYEAARRGGAGDYGELAVKSSAGTLVGLPRGIVHRDGVVAVKASAHGLFITSTLARDPRDPRMPNVTPPRSAVEADERLELLEEHLAGLGLRTDLREAALSRADAFKDVALDRPYGDYFPGLEACNLQRLSPSDLAPIEPFCTESRRRSSRALGEHTYGRLYSERAVVLYSKTAHLLSSRRHREYAARAGYTLSGRRVARFEGRYLKARSVQNHLKVKTGAELVASWDRVGEAFGSLVADTLALPMSAGGSATSAPTTRLETLAESGFGRGMRLIWADLAVTMAEEALRLGTLDIEGLRAKYAAAGVRKSDIEKVLGCVLAHVSPGEHGSAWDALGDLRDRLSQEAIVWPNSKE